MTITEARAHLRELLAEIPEDVKVYAGPSDYASPEQTFIVRVVVGPNGEEAQERLDELLSPHGPGSVKEALEADRAIGVLKHSGYRPYPAPDGPPLLGAEWTVNAIL